MMTIDASELDVFPDEPVPQWVLGVPEISPYEAEYVETDRFFRHRRWRDVSGEDADDHSEGLIIMSTEALAYYLPAFLGATLHSVAIAESLMGKILFALDPSPYCAAYFATALYQRLTGEQREVVRRFLLYLWSVDDDYFRPDDGEDSMERKHLKALWQLGDGPC